MRVAIKDLIVDKISGEWGEEGDEDSGVKVIRTTNFTNKGVIDFSNVVYRNIEAKKIEKKKLAAGDIIIEKSGGSPTQPVGRVVFFEGSDDVFLCNNFTAVLRPDASKVYPKYFFYQLFNAHKKGVTLKHQNKTTGIINLRLDDYLKEKVTLPESYEDQIRIAKMLGKAEFLIHQRSESLQLLGQLLRDTFFSMFGDPVKNEKEWERKSVKKVCSEIVDCVNKTAPVVDYVTKYRMIRTSNVRNGEVNLQSVRCVTEEIYQKWVRRSKPKKGDVIFTREAPVGEAGILKDDDNVFLGQRTMQYRADPAMVNPFYLLYEFMGPFIQRQITQLSSGSTVKHLPVPACEKFIINVPPVDLQNEFAAIVEKIEALRGQYRNSLAQLENLYDSLSQEAFSLKIVDLKTHLNLDQLPVEWPDLPEDKHETDTIQPKIVIHDSSLPPQEPGDDNQHLTEGYSEDKGGQTVEQQLVPWQTVSAAKLAEWLKEGFGKYYFTSEMVIRYLKEEKQVVVNKNQPLYYSSEEIKKSPSLDPELDLKKMLFDALQEGGNPFLSLEQHYYDAEEENFELSIRDKDYELLKNKSREERSGIYLLIKE